MINGSHIVFQNKNLRERGNSYSRNKNLLRNDILVTHCIRICTVHYDHISKVISFVDVDGTFPEFVYTILVILVLCIY